VSLVVGAFASVVQGSQVLTTLLPGLRDLRAPLAAGFVYLLALWIGLQPPTDQDEATGIWADVLALQDAVSIVGLGAAVGFVAYLAGSVSIMRTPFAIGWFLGSESTGGNFPLSVSQKAEHGLSEVVERAWERAIHQLEGTGIYPPDLDAVGVGLSGLRDRIKGEFEEIRTRLLIKEPELFSKVDRLRSEGELRLAIFPALVALAVALSSREEEPLALLTATLAILLAVQGLVRYRQSNNALVEALRIDAVRAPILDRLTEFTANDEGLDRLRLKRRQQVEFEAEQAAIAEQLKGRRAREAQRPG
jgi:hypothetical protein